MAFDDPLGQCEAEARASCVTRARLIETREALEHALTIVRRDAGAVVVDCEAHGASVGAQRHLNGVMSEARRVVEKVADYPRHLVATTGYVHGIAVQHGDGDAP